MLCNGAYILRFINKIMIIGEMEPIWKLSLFYLTAICWHDLNVLCQNTSPGGGLLLRLPLQNALSIDNIKEQATSNYQTIQCKTSDSQNVITETSALTPGTQKVIEQKEFVQPSVPNPRIPLNEKLKVNNKAPNKPSIETVSSEMRPLSISLKSLSIDNLGSSNVGVVTPITKTTEQLLNVGRSASTSPPVEEVAAATNNLQETILLPTISPSLQSLVSSPAKSQINSIALNNGLNECVPTVLRDESQLPCSVNVNMPPINLPPPSVTIVNTLPPSITPVGEGGNEPFPSFSSTPPFPFPPIIVNESRSRLRNLLPLILIALFADDFGFNDGSGCCCCCKNNNVLIPFPIPIPTNCPVINT